MNRYNTLNEQVDRLKNLMGVKQVNESFFSRQISPEKRAQVIQYLESGENPNKTAAYNQFKQEDPAKAEKYVEFFASYPNGYPKWDGEKFVEQVPTSFLSEEEPNAIAEDGSEAPRNMRMLGAPEKSKINRTIQRVTEKTYFEKIPLEDVFNVLYEYGLVPLQEDQTHWEGWLTGAEGSANIALGHKASEYEGNNGIPTYVEISNAALTITWYKMSSGKWEFIAYIG